MKQAQELLGTDIGALVREADQGIDRERRGGNICPLCRDVIGWDVLPKVAGVIENDAASPLSNGLMEQIFQEKALATTASS